MKAKALLATLGVSAVLLTGCGGSTVTSDQITHTPSASPTTTAAETETTTSTPRPSQSNEPSAQDRVAREIDEVPTAHRKVPENEQEYLADLKEHGIKTADIEDQLVGTAQAVCVDDEISNATPQAVAGQLIAQERSDLGVDELTRIIEDAARKLYCP